MKKILLPAVIAVLFASCASDAPEMRVAEEDLSPKTNLEYALAYAEDFMGQLDPTTRGVDRQVADVQFVCNDLTRSGKQDTTLYLVNYADNMGFALLDAQAKNGGVYAISPKGHMEFSDSLNNPVLAHFFRRVKEVSATEEPLTRDGGPIVSGWKYQGYAITQQAGPVLCERYANWTCNNVKGAGDNGKTADVTSASVVIAKLLAYYTHPQTIDNIAINWDKISGSAYSNAEVFKLLSALNSKTMLGDNGSTSTGTTDATRKVTPTNVHNALSSFGLTDPIFTPSNGTDIFDTLSYRKVSQLKIILHPTGTPTFYQGVDRPKAPVICYAKPKVDKSSEFLPYYQYWIIDGFVDRVKMAGASAGTANIVAWYPSLYHCVWGDNDYLNGYYYAVTVDDQQNHGIGNEAGYFTGTSTVEFEVQDWQMLFPVVGALGGFTNIGLAQP